MSQPPSERDRGGDEDLFEDLDQFFAPLEDSDWTGAEEAPGRGEAPDRGAAEGPASLEDLDALSIDIPDEDELLGTRPSGPSRATEPPTDLPVSEEEALLAAEEADEGGGPDAGPTAVPAGDEELADWEALRATAAGDETVSGRRVEADDEPLSVEDLRTAPPEYADLPGPGEEAVGEEELRPAAPVEEPVLAQEAMIDSLADLEGIQETFSSSGAEVPDQGFATDRIEVAPPGDEAEFAAPEGDEAAEPVDVEAAADHFATGMRESPADVEEDLLADLDQPSPQTVRIAPPQAAEQAPAWEEVGAPAEPEPEPAAAAPPTAAAPEQRNLTAAFASGLILAAAVIALLAIGKGPFVVLVVAVLLLAQAEFYAVMRSRGHKPATLLGLVAGALLAAGAYLRGEGALLLGVFIAMATTVLWYMAAPPERRRGLVAGAGATLLGVVYVPLLGAFALLLLRPDRYGTTLFLTVVGLTILYDVLAFAIGSWFGNRPLAPSISPSKSWEGAIGATLGVVLAGIAIVPSLEPFRPSNAVGLALVISALAPLGDLIESALKRDLGVKDMSGLLPGHGGMLDRIDALLITCPAAYYFLQIFL